MAGCCARAGADRTGRGAFRVSAASMLLACAVASAGCTLIQDRLFYFPARATVDQLAAGGLRPWPDAGGFRGLFAEPAGVARATAIVFHGNAGHAGDRDHYAAALVPLGLRVVLAEYPGYGPRPGTPGEAVFVADARAVVALAHRLYGPPLIVVGESLGAAVAAEAGAQERDRVAGLLLLTPWDRLAAVAAHHHPWLPVRWLLRDRYDSAAALASFDAPVLVAVAAADRIVPPRFGAALHEALPGPKRLVAIADAGHDDWPARVDARWWREAVDFLLGHARRR